MSQFDSFLAMSKFLVGVGDGDSGKSADVSLDQVLSSLDPRLGQTYFDQLMGYCAQPYDSGSNKDQKAWDTTFGAAPAPPPGATYQITTATWNDLLAAWDASGGDKDAFEAAVFKNSLRPDLSDLAQKVVIIWYSAMINNIPLDATTYDRALVWSISYAHPQAVPRSFGYWQYSPDAVALNNPPGVDG